jgi:hypothetical protein
MTTNHMESHKHVRHYPAPLPGVAVRRKDPPDSRIQAIELSIGIGPDDVAQAGCDRAHRRIDVRL